MGCDGASNMLGIKSGLSVRIKQVYPELLTMHCLNHRLELAFRDVFKTEANYQKLMSLLVGLYYFYIRSHKQKQGLKRTFVALEIKRIHPPQVNGNALIK